MLEILSRYRQFVVTGMLILFSITFLGFFPESDTMSPVFQGFIVSVVFFLVIPILYSKIVLKESLKKIGWQKGNVLAGILSSIVSVALAGIAVFFLVRLTPFQANFRFPVLVETNFFWFMLYELVLVSFMILLYEVFFRGLVQLLWLRGFGVWAIFIQAGLFMILLYFGHDFSWQKAPLIIFAPFSGLITYFSRSIWYPIIASWFFFFLTDIVLLVLH